MNIKKEESKIKPEFKIASEFIDLRSLDTNLFVELLEERIRIRQMPMVEHIKKSLKK